MYRYTCLVVYSVRVLEGSVQKTQVYAFVLRVFLFLQFAHSCFQPSLFIFLFLVLFQFVNRSLTF